MNNKKLSMSDLEKEMASVEIDAVVEEQYNADRNYASLDEELKSIINSIPYPETGRYTAGIDYEDIDRIKYEKRANKPYFDKRDLLEKYCNNGSLYSGHLRTNIRDCFILDDILVDTKKITVDGEEIWLINVDDRDYSEYIRWWRYPGERKDIQFSRNITMYDRIVSDVDIILDKGNELFSKISDAYLRKALIRNKGINGIQSIIQTIQSKQDSIRSLPKEDSFVVQGCAGSGKTMVLLHRLRYLLYNKDIYDDEYVFLVPGNNFKEFIDEISVSFNISKKNILSYQEYYQKILGKKPKNKEADISELVFAPEYLEKVYSKNFIQESYRDIFELFSRQMDTLIEFFDGKLNELLESEKSTLKDEIETLSIKAIDEAEEITKKLQSFTKTKIENTYSNIQKLLGEIEETYLKRKSEYDIAVNPEENVKISSDDERIITNENLLEIKKNIEAEKVAIEKASIFTAVAHKSKLKKLQSQYDSVYEELEKKLIAEDIKKYSERASQIAYVFGDITITEIESIIEKLKNILSVFNDSVIKIQYNLDNINEYIGKKYAKEIDGLNKLITLSGDIANDSYNFVEELTPSYAFFETNISLGLEVINCFKEHITTSKEKERLKSDMSFFSNRSENQIYTYINTLLFNSCKKRIRQEFNIKICDVYKHYWYLSLYCSYLTKPIKTSGVKYIFVDEAQDLSVSEIELINKVISITHKPIINLFGDTNQMITTHGIKDWSLLKMPSQVYTLKENFRNTNQVVDYCNESLNMQMVKVGVDMEAVSEYSNIEDAIKSSESITQNAVFIVKDDYSVVDLKNLLSHTKLTDYEIHTVKSVKGLEFKEVFVFDSRMSLNEKYISYTRALAKLNVIKNLPETADRKTTLIVQ